MGTLKNLIADDYLKVMGDFVVELKSNDNILKELVKLKYCKRLNLLIINRL